MIAKLSGKKATQADISKSRQIPQMWSPVTIHMQLMPMQMQLFCSYLNEHLKSLIMTKAAQPALTHSTLDCRQAKNLQCPCRVHAAVANWVSKRAALCNHAKTKFIVKAASANTPPWSEGGC
jgi:hypothetical protein